MKSLSRSYGMGPSEKLVSEHISYCMNRLELLKDMINDYYKQILISSRKREQMITNIISSWHDPAKKDK